MKKIFFIIFICFFSLNGFSNTSNNENGTNVFEEYTLTIITSNGSVLKLLDNEETNLISFEEGETVRLVTRPAVGYKFSHWEGDVSGNRLIADVVMTGNKSVIAVFEEWVPATGIPMPEFGIFETYRMYDNVANRNTELIYSQNAEGGYYTHYIDNTAPNATDSSNKYGTEAKPRVSMPSASDIPEGSVVEYHGITYTRGHTVLKLTGTEQMPIFIRGASVDNHVEIASSAFYLNSEYVIMENLKLSVTVRSYDDKKAHHVAIRNFEAKSLSAVSYDDGTSADNVVFYGNYINRDQFDPADGDFEEADGMGVSINGRSDSVWIIDNIITRAGGDAVGNGHAANYTAKNYFVGRNIMYTCGENAVDIKEVDKVIVSENVMFNYKGWSSGSDGAAVVMHYGPNVSPKNVWVVNNEIFDCSSTGIQVGGDQVYDVYLIGNLIHDIHNESNTAKGYISWSSQKVYMINNTFYNVDNGINSSISNPNAALFATNNIISNVSEGGYHMSIGGSTHMSNSIFENNLYYQPDGVATLNWGSNSYTVPEFIANTGKGAGSIEGNPLFVNPEAIDFSLQSNSPAIDAGIEHSTYQLYENLYGMSIKNDANGVAKPNGDAWDIGAYEFNFFDAPIDTNNPTINREELRDLIASSKGNIEAATLGNAEGEYTQVLVDDANAAVADAETSLANATTQNEIDQATIDLAAAMELFVPNSSNMELYLYPNPVIDTLVLENISDVIYISIFNATGSLIKTVSNTNNTMNLDLSNLSTGVYYLNLYTSNEVISKTILKK
ncbi:T9SS type A sorting domain-containing protein [Cellulophaga sp. HaHaR_3_176]|uniref:T9SS type A sorting domain-containing protein n=1 Tax=Cellulophaga sp. HaHaR_3_176 TaxID=1942464 RepID=UPI001C1F9929|nr:T9SS type A sorting domain-containing protein [Cellulophaga sp. HaHaR_3_176]QWX85020.1 T9SS type A sorting domain-containing protein [Cellulophaga sp. HaHaR_3_176]